MTWLVWRWALVAAMASGLGAQTRFDAEAAAGRSVVGIFERALEDRSLEGLDCQVRTQPARLSFDLQIFTGYEFTLPLRQFEAGKQGLLLNVFRVTPNKPEGAAVWFVRRWPLPEFPEKSVQSRRTYLQLGGGFIVGPGEYQVDWLLLDGRDRVCRKSWKVKAKEARAKSLGIEEGLVDDDRRLMAWKGPGEQAGAEARRATIFLHAAPTFRRRVYTRLSFWDRRLLLTSLRNTVERGGFTAARVVVFDLERRQVLFEAEEFGAGEYRRLGRVLGEVDLATIDYGTLSSGETEWAFLEKMVGRERGREADAVVFITPAWRDGQRRQRLREGFWEGGAPVFAVALAPAVRYTTGAVVDFAKALRGRVLSVYQPMDLAAATERLRRELEGAAR
jgi:hypothetical protein